MAQKTQAKKTSSKSNVKGSASAKNTKAAKNAKVKKKTQKSIRKKEERQKEIIGIVICMLGIFLFVSLFASSASGVWGAAIKTAIIGILGSIGYLVPFSTIALGIALIARKNENINWKRVTLWAFVVISVLGIYHGFFFNKILDVKASEMDFSSFLFTDYVKASYDYAISTNFSIGAFGAIITYPFYRAIGVAGLYIVFITYIIAVIIVKSRKSIKEVSHDVGERINDRARGIQTTISEYRNNRSAGSSLYIDDLRDDDKNKNLNKEYDIDIDFLNKHTQNIEAMQYNNENDPFIPIGPVPGDGRTSIVSQDKWAKALEGVHIDDTKRIKYDDNGVKINIPDTSAQSTSGKKPKNRKIDGYRSPSTSILEKNTSTADVNLRSETHLKALKLEETLRSFRVEAKVVNITCGPTVTRFELHPAPGVKVARISSLSNDIALSLAAEGVRIEAPIPGKSAVGIEIPNKIRMTVNLRDMLDSDAFLNAKSPVSICVGKDITGKNVVADLTKMPHMLVAGATGSGKSVFINSLILSLLYKSPPSDVRMIMIDPKKVELNVYNGIPHLLIPVVSNANKAAGALNWAVKEMTDRYELFSKLKVRNLDGYNLLASQDDELEKLPRVVIIIDELADLMQVCAAEVEGAICRLAQLARAAGMHLVIATQRPDVRVITGNIKANIPCRIAFSVNQYVDSKTILDGSGAEKLMPRGDMLFKPGGAPKPLRLQGAFVSDDDVESVCNMIRIKEEKYDEKVIDGIEKLSADSSKSGSSNGGLSDDFDNLVPDACKVIFDQESGSTSMIQRKLRVGYNRAARLMDDMERLGIVGPPEGGKPREILVTYGHAMEIINGGTKSD